MRHPHHTMSNKATCGLAEHQLASKPAYQPIEHSTSRGIKAWQRAEQSHASCPPTVQWSCRISREHIQARHAQSQSRTCGRESMLRKQGQVLTSRDGDNMLSLQEPADLLNSQDRIWGPPCHHCSAGRQTAGVGGACRDCDDSWVPHLRLHTCRKQHEGTGNLDAKHLSAQWEAWQFPYEWSVLGLAREGEPRERWGP